MLRSNNSVATTYVKIPITRLQRSRKSSAALNTTLNALEDTNENNDVAALNSLYAFCNSVDAQRGKKISLEDADSLIASVNAIIASIDELATPCQ